MKEKLMTAKDMIAALERAKVEDYIDEVLEDMSEDDLYCNFRLNGDWFDFRETDRDSEYKDYREDYSIDTCVDNLI
jgi:hypothetical protein